MGAAHLVEIMYMYVQSVAPNPGHWGANAPQFEENLPFRYWYWYSVRFGPKQHSLIGLMDLGGARPPAGPSSQTARPNVFLGPLFW